MTTTVESLFLRFSVEKLAQFEQRIEVCLSKLTEEQIWARGHENENAIGNLVLHLSGNVTQWILGGLDGAAIHRDRDGEFATRGGMDAKILADRIRATVEQAMGVIANLTTEDLTRSYSIQNYQVSGVDAVYHVVEHFAQHTAQIIFATKILTEEDLGFYRHLKQPAHEENVP